MIPQDLDAERAALACMLLDGEALNVGARRLNAASFTDSTHILLFSLLQKMARDGAQVDLVTLKHALAERGELEQVGGVGTLADLAESVPSVEGMPGYVAILRKLQQQRAIISIGHQLQSKAGETLADPAEIVAEYKEKLAACGAPPNDAIAVPMTAAALVAQYPEQREPVIDGVLRVGEIANLVSGPKAFKSWTLLNLALAVAMGEPFVGFPTRRGRVLLLDYELAGGTLAKRLRAVADAMFIDLGELNDSLAVASLRGKRLDIDGLAEYASQIEPGRYSLMIVDPLYRVFPSSFDENSNADMAGLYGKLQAIATAADAAMVICHHASKGSQADKMTTDLGSGAGSQSRACDAHLAIRPHAEPDCAVISAVLRSFPPIESFGVRWTFPLWAPDPTLDPAALWRPPKRTARKDETTPSEPKAPPWTIDRFAETFLGPDSKTRDAILAAAASSGMSRNQAEVFLKDAEATGRAFRRKIPGDKRSFFASLPQPALEGVL